MHLKKTVNFVSSLAILLLPLAILFFPQSNKYDWVGPMIPFLGALLLVVVVYAGGMVVGNKQIKSPGLLLLFVGWTILSFSLSDIRSFGFAEVLVTVSSAALFLYVAGEDARAVFRHYIPHVIIFVLLVSAALGVWTFLSTDHERFFGLFYNPLIKADAWPNAYASFFLLAFPFLFSLADRTCDFRNKTQSSSSKSLLFAVIGGFLVATFLLTYSRAGFIAFGIELVLLAIMFRPKPCKRCAISLVVFLIFAICSTYLIHSFKNTRWNTEALEGRMTFSDSVSSSSYTERLEFFQGSVDLIAMEPIFGYGPMSFKWAYPQVQGGFLAISDHSHNVLLKYGVERGLPAVLFFLGLLFVIFWTNNPFKKEAATYDKIAWVALLGLLAHSMVDYNLNFITIEFLFWIVLASITKGKSARFAGGGMAISAVLLTLISLLVWQMQDFKEESVSPTTSTIEKNTLLLPRFVFYELYDQSIGNDELTEVILKKQLDINSHDTLTMWRLGQLYEQQGKNSKAEEQYKKAIEVNPKNTFLVYLDLIKLEMKLGNDENVDSLKNTIVPLIEEYETLYAINLHYTQSSNEKVNVDELKSLLGI